MNVLTMSQAKWDRWIGLKWRTQLAADLLGSKPTKPSKLGSVGFEGITSPESSQIDRWMEEGRNRRAGGVSRCGRSLRVEGMLFIGVKNCSQAKKRRQTQRTDDVMRQIQQNSTESTQLSRQQIQVITALAKGGNVTDATREADVDRTTFYLWLRSDPAFQAEFNRAKLEQVQIMRAQIRSLADVAVATIREMPTESKIAPAVRLKAALAVIEAVGAHEPESIGATDPEEIEHAQSLEIFGCF
jgi:hypothetical protein